MADAEIPQPPLFAMGTSVYAQRKGEILILKRALGALSGSWFLAWRERGERLGSR